MRSDPELRVIEATVAAHDDDVCGAATLALHGTGVGLGAALALGFAFQAVETFVGVTLGLGGAAILAAPGTPTRRWSMAAAGLAAVLVATALGVATIDF